MDLDDAERFAAEWAAAWNSHDIERIMAHYRDDVTFVSPVAGWLLGNPVVQGKEALRAYFSIGLEKLPNLRFDVTGVQFGIDTVVITYRNERGQVVSEVLTFDGELVAHGRGTYGRDPANA